MYARYTTMMFLTIALYSSVYATQVPRLEGCDAPELTAERMRQMALTTSDWRTVSPPQVREKWHGLLNQVDCPEPGGGTYLLAAFDRVIKDEPQCGVTFAIRAERDGEQRLTGVNMFYSGGERADVLSAVERFVSVWRPGGDARIESDEPQWTEQVTKGGDATGTLRWRRQVGAACTVSYEIDKSIRRTAPGWTTKVSLSADWDCGR